MLEKIPEETKELILKLHSEGAPVLEIVRITKVPNITVYACIRAKEKNVDSIEEVVEALAKEQGLSVDELRDKVARERGYLNYNIYLIRKRRREHLRIIVKEMGFPSVPTYRDDFARKKNHKSWPEYKKFLDKEDAYESLTNRRKKLAEEKGKTYEELKDDIAKEKGQPSWKALKEHLAIQEGHASQREFLESLAIEKGHESLYHFLEWLEETRGIEAVYEYEEFLERGVETLKAERNRIARRKGHKDYDDMIKKQEAEKQTIESK